MTDADFLRIVTGGKVLPGLTSGRESIAVFKFEGYGVVIWLYQ